MGRLRRVVVELEVPPPERRGGSVSEDCGGGLFTRRRGGLDKLWKTTPTGRRGRMWRR
ncbi:MAG: hypothetical protein GU356_11850 [Pyrobaculum sp.]|nr:hypothetical protein [Pyrobaculum sp.]